AKKIMGEFSSNKIPANIVGEHLYDISAELKEYEKKTEDLMKRGLISSKNTVDNLAKIVEKEFTYDWLEKNDPKNFCLGLYCNCCANLAGVGYGIMRSNFVRPDIQNLVIKNKKGTIIAKSTLYVNEKEGYGVFNNVEVSTNVRYEDKEKIYKAYMEGVNAFAEGYNKTHPKTQLRKLSVGMHLNDLNDQISNGNKPSEILRGVNFGDYGIPGQKYEGDWSKGEQRLVWEIENNKNSNSDKSVAREL
ncbi:MAG: hypothetical protein RR400_03100, partial [Clostridia bacterium]